LDVSSAREEALCGLERIAKLTITHQLNEDVYYPTRSHRSTQNMNPEELERSTTMRRKIVSLYQHFIEYQLHLWTAYRGNRLRRVASGQFMDRVKNAEDVSKRLNEAAQSSDALLVGTSRKLQETADSDIHERQMLSVLLDIPNLRDYPQAASGANNLQ
jgi:ADP-dependent phosphofructokinase/glucokinase